jgi:hypothetical protein
MMRKAEKVAPSLLLVRDAGGAVFGAYVTDAWRYAPRFYGTGESYVFQVGGGGLQSYLLVHDSIVCCTHSNLKTARPALPAGAQACVAL